jgi:catechol 2,3-dioxygenase-like lactoylglutathione lyase family enzyme
MTDHNDRPELWVGHMTLTVSDPGEAHDYYVALGMRTVLKNDDFAISELRGGTHLIFQPGEVESGDAPFDFMVEDLPATHQRLTDQGVDVSEIMPGDIHSVFVITDPDGYRIVVYDSHVVGPV